jgi:uncharacterized protein (TIGR00251 family)
MIAVEKHSEGCVFRVRAQPGAKRKGVLGEHAGALRLAVAEPALDGRANRALAELLRMLLDVRRSQVELIAGETSRDKKFLVRGAAPDQVQAALGLLLQLSPAEKTSKKVKKRS